MKNNNKSGFTLIELLIVIAILGILALTLIAAIDPFEQLKKGRDTSTKNTVSEIYNASLRYYANKGYFPWGDGSTISPAKNLNALSTAIVNLQNQGELKEDFLNLLGSSNANKVYVTSESTDKVIVCFKPESKAGQAEDNARFDQSGADSASCKTTKVCYWCLE